jgi:hypothetical protein
MDGNQIIGLLILLFIVVPVGMSILGVLGAMGGAGVAAVKDSRDKTAHRAMRLGTCPDCLGNVSKEARSCPHCGKPLNASSESCD